MIIHTTGNDLNRGRNAAFSKKPLIHSSRECSVEDTSLEELCERFVGVVLTTGITSIGYGNGNERILFSWIFRSLKQKQISKAKFAFAIQAKTIP